MGSGTIQTWVPLPAPLLYLCVFADHLTSSDFVLPSVKNKNLTPCRTRVSIQDNICGILSTVPNTWQQIAISSAICHEASLVCIVLVELNN